jgi:hypothetical protein
MVSKIKIKNIREIVEFILNNKEMNLLLLNLIILLKYLIIDSKGINF